MDKQKILLRILAVLFLLWNIIVFSIYGIDKQKAKSGKWRISENVLLSCAFLMGGAGALIGMRVFHHKTRHVKFKIGVPVALLLNIAVIFALIYFMAPS